MGEPLSESEFAAFAFSAGYKSCCELGHGVFVQRSPHKPKTDVDPCEVWCRQPVDKLREYCNVIKICIFWPLLFQSESNYLVADWGSLQILDWNWKKLCDLELVEDLVDLTKKVVNVPHFIGGILRIGSRLENGFFDVRDALDWIRCAGDVNILQKLEKLGDFGWLYLETFFGECKHYITKVALEDCNLVEEFKAVTCENCRKKSESMKQKGNEEFSQGKFDHAIISYTKAIEFCPTNHLLYGNRALCLILTKQYKKALADGKRATILKPNWPKGHYHFCKALSLLGEHELALEANERAQELCKNILDGLKDLIQQNDKLKKTLEEIKGTKEYKQKPKDFLEKKDSSSSGSHLIISQEHKEIEKDRKEMQFDHEGDHYHQKHDTTVRYTTDGIPRLSVTNMPRTENKVCSLDFPPRQSHQYKGRSKNKPGEPEKKQDHLDLKIESKTIQDKLFCTVHQVDSAMLLEVVKSLIHDGYTALMDQRCHSAEQMFSQLLNIIDPSELKQLNLRIINYVVIIYGHATSLLGIGQPEALMKAEDQFKRIIVHYQEERFDCLAYYGIGKVYLRQNRFSDALNQFMKSQTMINRKIVPGVLTWPTTSQVIEETRTENLQLFLKNCIEECKFPPEPDAVCRYQHCRGNSKIQIFFTDPDFKGFIRITCCQRCRVEFHTSCWKKLKTANYSDKNDKDFLQELCFTPDCTGLISKIVIFSSSGLVKCEFEQKITKPKEPPRAIIKQKCSSFRKLKRKEEKKIRRKRAREDALNSSKQKIEENQMRNEQPQYRNRSDYAGYAGDQVLQRIIQNAEQIKTAVRDASKLLKELLSWFVISEEAYTSYCKTSSKSHVVVEQLISYLVQEENRVKTRAFIRVLSELEEVDPKLQRWMKHLNDLGFTATVNFILQYGQFLKQLDFSILSALWNEKYGSKFDYVSNSSESKEILDYFLKPPLEKVRCFIWLLEDNRENFPSLHQALDEFFNKTDNPTIILKKQGNEDILTNGIKGKNKSRKKNYKDSRSVLVLSSGVSTAPQEENTFIEENALGFTYYEPCIIPEYLRGQLDEFEAVYDISNSNNCQRLDANLSQTCESLYDYFSQILEEHGPMELNNKLLVGEYEHFPEEARKIVEDEGGLKSFLLKSHRFVMVDNFISLRHDIIKENKNRDETENNEEGNYIVCDAQENSFQNKIQLNPAAKEFKPLFYPEQPHISTSTDIPLESCETPQYLPYSLPTSWQSVLSQDIDPVENMPYFSKVLFYRDFQNQSRFLPQTSWGYQCERTSPVTSPVPLLSNVAKQPGYIYADGVTHQDNDELATSDRKYVSSSFIPAEIETFRDPPCLVENSDSTFYEDSFAVANSTNEAECDIQVIKKEKESRGIPVMKNNPHTRMVAVQVNNEVTDRETNTLPFHPFEKQQGDILRMEKEHQVLKEQLKEAQEKYEQLQNRSSEEISVLEELIKKTVQERGIFKKEVEWLHQALEIKVKKWQQEKKESQENLKAMRNTAKKHVDTNDRYSKTIDEKEKQYNTCLNTYLETSNKFANKKVKLEELIKKSQDDFKEHEKRAVKAEVSVLKNWKESELYKLNGIVSKAEANLKMLKSLSSSSASSLPDLKSQINYWEVFISNIKKQMEKVKVGYEEKIEKVKNGVRNCLTKIETVDLSSLPSVLRKQSKPAVGDPALVPYSSASAHPNLLPAVSSSEDQGPTTASLNTQAGVKPANANSKVCSASDGSVKTNTKAWTGSYADKVSLTSMSKFSGINTQNIQPNQTHQDDSATQMKPSSNNTSENIIAHLQTIFPGYSSSEFARFIKDVQGRSGNTLSLSSTEILSRVTDLILDQQNEASTSVGRPLKSTSSASAGQTGTQSQVAAAEGNVSSAPQARPAHKSTSSKNMLPSQPNLQPWGNAGATPKAKWKKLDYIPSSDDPCIICHDELSRDSCELECGHHFHRECIRKWLKEHSSTCPICRIHVLLPEDFPELPARNKHA
ncbi:E3 ubiquitin-protein ligase TTC3 isoform X1 [Lagopus leucura]|uniref:E3 ubiquitin-protein ligase TTC3 isoform X1 n=2 Tax=Lagopus leucura TaxID=30410 RepID=UPI001C66CFB9|nr:E3 ubiquitin-protein ligase TTC3 isoform X1 [Lagopus leucura]XP_042722668.1 E3 ubiquitin-protein ligase TTC3 isoform X1 [Lagopus leucura]